MSTHLRVWLASAAVIASAAMASCNGISAGHRDHVFSTHAFVTSATGIDEDAAARRAMDQIIARGIEVGLVIEETSSRAVTLTSTTATPGAATDAPDIDDTRRVVARAEFKTTADGISYDYHISLRGPRPKNTTSAHERNVVAGLFLVREVFERPLDVDLDEVRGTR